MKNNVVCKITKKEKKLIDGISVCSLACQKLIEQVVKHFENNELAHREWWKQAGLKYNLDIENLEYTYKPLTGEIVLLGSVKDKEVEKMISNTKAKNFIVEQIKKGFEEATRTERRK